MTESVTATLLFADLMNSTEMAKNLTLQEYDEMLENFQAIVYEVVSHHLQYFGYRGRGVDSEFSVVGDEVKVFLYSENVRFDIRNILLVAIKIKLAWLASDFNQKILKEGRLVSRVGAGINCGTVMKGVRDWRVKMGQKQPIIEGYAINLTKRIESASRDGSVYQIMAGDSLYRASQENRNINAAFSRPISLVFKGIGQKIPVYELVSFINFEILPSMPASFRNDLVEKMEYAVTRPMPEPWIFMVLLRHYISRIVLEGQDHLEAGAVKLAQQALEMLEYKPVVYNILGWLHAYGNTVHNLELAFHYFDQCLNVEPRNEAALLHRARILDRMGHTELAWHAYEQLLLQNNDHHEARTKLEHYRAGRV